MSAPVLELRNAVVQFAEHTVLAGVNLQVRAGERLVLIGPSGHGKTSLLKTLAGLVPIQSGELLVENKNWWMISDAERFELLGRMGMLFQKNALFDSWTCFENVAFPLRERTREPEEAIQKKVEQFLEAVGLSHARDLWPDEISGGMQKRLGIARALALRPQILFYDDPTAGLDPITSRKIIDLILQMQKEDRSTVVAVTNDMRRAEQLGDRLVYVGDTEIVITGSPKETWEHSDPRVRQFVRGSLEGPLTAGF